MNDAPWRPAGDPPEKVAFQHKFFTSMENPYFRISPETERPGMYFRMADNPVVLHLPGIKREFKLDGHPDGAMLDWVAAGLRFVKALMIGDAIPAELRTGEASWQVEPRHTQIAYSKLAGQLMGWITGAGFDITDAKMLEDMANDAAFKEEVGEAFDQAAQELGLEGAAGREQVVQYIERLAAEWAYVEAVRERFAKIVKLKAKLTELEGKYRNDRMEAERVERCRILLEAGIEEWHNRFQSVDADHADVMGALRDVEARIIALRDTRDDLWQRMLVWDDLLREWDFAVIKRSAEALKLIDKTYRFLAPRYMEVDEWVLASTLVEDSGGGSGVEW